MIYVFNGPPGTGKDDACKWLLESGHFQHISFKSQLIKETLKFFDVTEEWFFSGYNRAQKELPEAKLLLEGKKLSRRQALIYVSEDYIKPKYGKQFFGECVANEIRDGVDYCVSDGGFIEEIQPVINKIGTDQFVLVQLYRDGFDFSSDSRRYINTSILLDEIVLGKKSIPLADQTIVTDLDIDMVRIHNNGSLEEFKTAIQNLHEKVSNVREKNKRTQGQEKAITVGKSV